MESMGPNLPQRKLVSQHPSLRWRSPWLPRGASWSSEGEGGGSHKHSPPPEQADLRLKIAKQNLLGDPGCQVPHPDGEPLPAREHVGHPQEQETPASLC